MDKSKKLAGDDKDFGEGHSRTSEKATKSKRKVNSTFSEPSRKCLDPNPELLFPYFTQDQKLVPAMSDSNVCGYPLPIPYPVYQDPLLFYPFYHATTFAHSGFKLPAPEVKTKKKSTLDKIKISKDGEPCRSLPPGTDSNLKTGHQRRFSDPGLVPSAPSDDSSSSASSSSCTYCCDERINLLTSENERLAKEVTDLKEEIFSLKSSIELIRDNQNNCIPGVVSDLVNQLKNASEIRERAIFGKLQNLIKDHATYLKRTSDNGTVTSKKDLDYLKEKLQEAAAERYDVVQRMNKLENYVDVHLKELSPSSKQIRLEQEELQVRRQLQETFESLKQSRPNSRHQVSNGASEEEKLRGVYVLNSLETCESLTSSLGSGSLPLSPVVTMTGPVTDV